ncbi:uncharacterized protein [Amphiura filiformis]|uniref:uncharacterized protein isoform X1 n=1 Tax=Amphiura filiformis TaxID=82378 RepID=UPI003B20CDE8
MKCTSALKRNLINEDGTVVYLWIKVLGSEFISQEQFHQICEENNKYLPKLHVTEFLWHNAFGPTSGSQHAKTRAQSAHKRKRACGEFGNGKDDKLLGKQSETRENQQKRAQESASEEVITDDSESSCYLYVKWASMLRIMKGNMMLSIPRLEVYYFRAICKDNSVDLIHTQRLKDQIIIFTSELRSKFSNTLNASSKFPFLERLHEVESPLWACKVLASEFSTPVQFHHFCQENKQHGPLPNLTEVRIKRDFEAAFETLPLRDTKRRRTDFLADRVQESEENAVQLSNCDIQQEETDTNADNPSFCYLNVNLSRMVRVIKRNNGWLNKLHLEMFIFKTICEQHSVGLIYTSRLRSQIICFISILRSIYMKLCVHQSAHRQQFYNQCNISPPWACKVLASEFYRQEEFHQSRQMNKHGSHPQCMRYTSMEDWAEFEVAIETSPIEDMSENEIIDVVTVDGEDLQNGPQIALSSNGVSSDSEETETASEGSKIDADSDDDDERKMEWIQCDVCECNFKNPIQLLLHSKWHQCFCCYCGIAFISQTSLKLHLKTIHNTTKQCKCQANQGKWMKLKLAKMKLHICPWCNKHYDGNDDIKHHYTCATYLTINRIYCCLCYKGFTSHSMLTWHKKVSHPKFISCFKCKYCQRYINDFRRMKRHVQRHEKKYKRFWMTAGSVSNNNVIPVRFTLHTSHPCKGYLLLQVYTAKQGKKPAIF